MKPAFTAVVMFDQSRRPLILFKKDRIKYHAVAAQETGIALVTLDTLRGYVYAERKGKPYPVKRAASFWLNHDHRLVAKRAKCVLRGLVARKAREEASA